MQADQHGNYIAILPPNREAELEGWLLASPSPDLSALGPFSPQALRKWKSHISRWERRHGRPYPYLPHKTYTPQTPGEP